MIHPGTRVEVTMAIVPGTADRQWEATVQIGGEYGQFGLDTFRGSSDAVLAALQVTLAALRSKDSL